jgi:hypothetical protein
MDREVLRNYRYQVMGKENNLKVYRLKHLVRKDRGAGGFEASDSTLYPEAHGNHRTAKRQPV